jgi:hypothetical protein
MFFGISFLKNVNKSSTVIKLLMLLSIPFVFGFAIFKGRATWGLTYIWFSGVAINFLIFRYNFIFKPNNLIIFLSSVLTIVTFFSNPFLSIIPFIIFFYLCVNYFQAKPAKKITSNFK